MSPTRSEIILAYRHLYQHLLRAVQYSKPARYTARDHLRNAFRNSSIDSFDKQKIATTLGFLDNAAKFRGLEHRIVKNLMHVWWERAQLATRFAINSESAYFRKRAYVDFDRTVEKLNETMGMCIK